MPFETREARRFYGEVPTGLLLFLYTGLFCLNEVVNYWYLDITSHGNKNKRT